MTNLTEFLHMGGYAIYVWPAFIAVGVVLLTNLILPLVQHKKLLNHEPHP